MSTGARIRVSLAFVALWLTAWGAEPAHADPSDACRDLAARFANSAEQVGLGSLASLIACVTAESQDRAGEAETTPPPSSPQVATPPPAPEPQAAISPPREWGSWPLRAPWTFLPSETSPWDK